MNGKKLYLIDTNILIYFFDGQLSENQKNQVIQILQESFNISVISKIEFLGFKGYFDKKKYKKAKEFLNNATVIPLANELIDMIIDIKQRWNLKLGDAIISSTALKNNLTVVTRNDKDFAKIANLKIVNPFND